MASSEGWTDAEVDDEAKSTRSPDEMACEREEAEAMAFKGGSGILYGPSLSSLSAMRMRK